MGKLKRFIVKIPVLGSILLFIYRFGIAAFFFRKPLYNMVRWLFRSRETTNFTYHLEDINKKYLGSLIADILNIHFDAVMSYIKELEDDDELRNHISTEAMQSKLAFLTDKDVKFGRRIGWYAIARALKPGTIIETGVDKGLGACVLTAALKRNKEEGFEGRYYGTDINPEAGFLFSGHYADYGSIIYGDSIETLKNFEGTIDLFINDSDHSAEYEAEEYKIIADKLSEHAIIIGDNSDSTDKLLNFSLETKRHFLFFQERPEKHWFPGACAGFSFKR